jgi:protein involved in sex pheromone biosynthesis
MMIDESEGLLPSSKVVGDDYWQEKNFKGFKNRLKLFLLSLLMIQGRFILKRE